MTNCTYNYVKYDSRYLGKLTELLHRTFGIENKDKESLVRWKYFDKYHEGKTITYLTMDNEGRAVGHYCNIPIKVRSGNAVYKCMLCADMCTDPDHRGKGLITSMSKKVYEEVAAEHYDFSLGFSNTEGVKVDKYASNYQYAVVGKFARYVKLLIRTKQTPVQMNKVSACEKSPENQSLKMLHIDKNPAYLNWRYVRKPNAEYEIFELCKAGNTVGYAVMQFTDNKACLYDIAANSEDAGDMSEIIRAVGNTALNRKVRILVLNVLENNYWKKICADNRMIRNPGNSENYYLTVRIHNQNMDRDYLLEKNNWRLSLGDIL